MSEEKPKTSTPGHGGRRSNSGRKPAVPNGPYEVLAKAKAKNETFKAQIAELEYQERVGQLLPADLVAQVWAEQVRIAKDRLLAIPARVAPTVLRLEELRDVERAIRDALLVVLDELTRADATRT
ncbi:MAG: hypothetical protein EOM91_18500 [Sphingobacteriia bacterium]|nr:hypothetical protein [Sphingobacteriia bacterium]